MENPLGHSKPSIDYFSLTRPSSVLQTSALPSSSHWDLSPYSDTALQSPTSGESVAVSPISPRALPFSGGQYTLPFQQPAFDRKGDQAGQYNNGVFEDWMQWGGSGDSIPYSADQSDAVNFKLEPISPVMEALELSGRVGSSQMPTTMCGGLDDGSVAFQDSMMDGPLFPAPQDIPSQPNGAFYTSQHSWPHSQHDYQANQSRNHYSQLSSEEASNLMRISMPQTATIKSSESAQQARGHRKRKTSTSSASSGSSSASSHPPPRRHSAPKKTAHNMIEKRYRTNLNDKIAALRDSVPSLRITEKISNGDASIGEDLQGLEAAHKLNKATILSKATEYIAHLESRNEYLVKECQGLKDRIDAFEVLLMSRSGSGSDSNTSTNPVATTYHQNQKSKWRQPHHQQSRK